MIRLIFTLIFLGSIGYGLWWTGESYPELKDKALQALPTSSFTALEPRFTANQIMESEKPSLLSGSRQQFGDYSVAFQPFLLMEVKFTRPNDTTGEGIILWDLLDGEMILDVQTWEKSHGFADCINMHADAYELKILSTIAHHGNRADRQTLLQAMNMEGSMLDNWIDRCLKKKLIVGHHGVYRIHLESPKMAFTPLTRCNIPLITKSSKHPEKIKKTFSSSQVTRIAEAAFGNDFAIRQIHEVFLPIYCLTVQNSDGSFQTTHWNSLNGQKLLHTSHRE